MQLVLTALGSYGDVLPMVGLGATAKARGHSVRIISNPYFAPVFRDAGLDWTALGTMEEYLALTRDPQLWHPLKGPRRVMEMGAGRYLRTLFDLLRELYAPGETVFGAHGLDLASRVLQDYCGAPVASIHFAPLAIRSLEETPAYFGMWTSSQTPRWIKSLEFWLADRLVVDRVLGGALNALRRDLGLPPVRRIFESWHQSPTCVLGLFPAWFAPPQVDWPQVVRLTGFPLWDAKPAEPLPDEVEAFLSAGEPPIVFMPGSANAQAAEYFSVAVESCMRLGRRALLLSKFAEQIPRSLPDSVGHFSYVPLSRLLPRAAALAHHGGIGTTAQGLAGGAPQLAMPMAYDQLDNALRIRRLGVGDFLRVKQWNVHNVVASLRELLASTSIASQCRDLARRCDRTQSLDAACDALEQCC